MKGIEITTVIGCRVQCTFCPQSVLMNNYEEKNELEKITFGQPVMMSFETFKTCIDKLPSDVDIHFAGYAEPWLNPQCTKMLRYAHEKGHKIFVFTTLVGMTTNDIELFKHVPFARFQIHLSDNEKYAKIAVNKNYLELLRKLILYKIHNLTCMSMGTSHKDIQEIIGMIIPPDVMIDRAGNSQFGEKTPRKLGPLVCFAASKNGINTLDQNVLLPNGDVCMCCMDYGMKYVIGNLMSSDYKSLFNSQVFRDILQKLSSEDSDIICRVCPMSIPANKKNDVKLQEYENVLEPLYRELLFRSVDDDGINYFGAMLQSKKMTIEDVRKSIIESDEYKRIYRLVTVNQDITS